MSTFIHAESRRLYSWWWDSHISPKNSKWLQENLTDMDLKVKAMIKLIEEDADSFARRAEMYYKKRPELMKFVEDFYRAYRALAERYDHATGALRHAHQTIAEAFPNHIPLALPDESPSISPGTEMGSCTPEMPSPLHPIFDPDDLQKDALGGPGYFHTVNRNVSYAEENETFATKKGLKQLNEKFSPREVTMRVKLHEGKVRKGLSFQEEEDIVSHSKIYTKPKILSEQEVKEKENARNEIQRLQEEVSQLSIENQKLKCNIELESTNLDSSRSEVQNLRDSITKLQSEKEAFFLQDQQSREIISSMETEIFRSKYEFGKLNEEIMMGIVKLCSAEEQCLSLEEENQRLKLELEQRKKVLEEIRALSVENQNLLEKEVKEKENAKIEIKRFHEELSLVSNENQNLKLRVLSESRHLQLSRTEVQNMRDAMSKLESEKEAALLQSQLSQESISSLETVIFQAKDEIGKLHVEIVMGIVKLCSAEEQLEKANQSLKLELEERKRVLEEIQMLSVESQNLLEQEVKEKENIKNEIECLQGEISQLSIENQNLKSQIVSKSKHLDAYGTEVQNLRNAMSILEIKKEEAVFKNQLSLEGISSLKSDVFRAKEEIRKLHEEVFMGIVKLYSAEEQHLTLKTSNLNLKSEHEERKRRVEDLRISLQESDVQRVEAERSLQFWERLYNTSQEKVEHMTLEIQSYFEKLQDIECSKMGLEEGVRQLEDVNYNLNESILAYDSKLKHLQDEIVSLKEIKSKLEDEINIHLEDSNVLQQELDYIKDDRNELDIKHKSLIEQLEVASLNMGSLEILVKELQFVCAELKEGCRKLEDEKLLLFNELEDMETISERNAVLENSLSDAMEKIRVLEDSCESLNAKDSTHAIEKATLASQIEVIAENMEKLSEKNIILEISLADANTELEGLRLKLKELEESSQFLSDENSNILLQNNALISQVESVRYVLTNLETKYAMLEVNHLNLEKEKDVSVTQVMELEDALKVKKIELDSLFQSSKMCLLSLENQINLLQEDIRFKEEELEVVQQEFTSYIIEILVLQICLCDMKDSFRTEKQKHESLIQSSEISLAALERQINLLQEEGQDRDEEFEEQQQKYMNSMLEIFILQKCLSEMKVKNFILLQECQKHIANSRCAGELISQLEGSKLLLKEKNTLLVEHNARLMDGIDLLLESLDINKTLVNTDGSEDVFLQTILGEINNVLACISDVSDENQHLRTELSVYHTFLKQNSLEKVFIGQELGRMAGQLLVFQRDQDQLSESCKKLGQDVNDKERMNGSLKDELASLCRLLADLSKDFANLREENSALEEENDVILEEAMTLEHLHLFFRSSNAESMQFLKVLDHEIYSLIAVKSVHEKIREGEERLKVVENENKHLKDSPFLFEGLRSQTTVLEFDLFTARYFCEDLILQVEIGENLLKKKSMELLKAYHKLHCTQEEVTKLCTKLNAANMEVDEAKMVRLRFEEKVGVLLEGHACKDLEIVNTYEGNRILNEELNRLNGKIELLRKSEQHLSSELQKKICELDRCEGEITNLLNEVQVSAVNGALLEDKMFEWAIAYEGLEICALVQREMLNEVITLRNAHVFELQKKLDDLEKENRELKDIWNSCLPLFISLGNSFATVEKQAHQLANLHEDQGIPSTDPQEEKNNETRKRDLATIAGALALQNLSSKLEGLEMLMLDTNNQLKQERLLYASNLESARREIEELKLETSDHQVKRGKETSRGKDGQLMKDIELDQVSNSNALSRIQSAESEDQMLKLWETAERDYSNSFSNGHGVEAVQEFKSEQHSSELVAVKEVGVDKLERSSEMKETQDEWNIRLIERLSTAAKKLSALKTTAQELKANMERTRKIKHLRSSEHDAMHNKLKQSDKEILELVDAVEKLRKKVEEYSKSSKGEEMGWLDRRQVIDQVRTVLVPIEKLELELQEMHYFFLKLDEEAGRNRTPEGDQTPRVLLRNYIKGWRVGQGRKRSHFCGCVGPKTQE